MNFNRKKNLNIIILNIYIVYNSLFCYIFVSKYIIPLISLFLDFFLIGVEYEPLKGLSTIDHTFNFLLSIEKINTILL